MYTQCANKHENKLGPKPLCSTCQKQVEKNSNNKPTYGYIEDRLEKGEDFRDPKGKAPISYGNIMSKMNISRHAAEREAASQNVIIPESQFEVVKTHRGRPKKDTSAVDTSESEGDTPKKTRGRPKKEKKVSEATTITEKIDEMVKQANADKPVIGAPVAEEELVLEPDNSSSDKDDEEEDGVEVAPFEIKGKTYLLDVKSNALYNKESWEHVGSWDAKNKCIIPVEDDED